MLTAARQARWFASRIIPIGGAVAGSFIIFLFAWTFTESIALTLLATAVLLIGAFGIFRSNGQTHATSAWGKGPIALALLAGWICVILISSLMGDAVIREIVPKSTKNQAFRSYRIAADGQLQIWTTVSPSNAIVKNETLTGEPLPLPPHNYWEMGEPSTITIFLPDRVTGNKRSYPATRDGFLQPETHLIQLRGQSAQWFFIPGSRTILAFDQQSRRYIGSLSPAGFAGPDKPAEPFDRSVQYSQNTESSAFIGSSQAVYALDLSANSATKIFSAPANDPVLGAASTEYISQGKVASKVPTFTVITTRSSLHILQDGKPPITVPIEYPYVQSNVWMARTSDGHFVVAYGIDWPVGTKPIEVSTYDATGKLVTQINQPITDLHHFSDDSINVEEVGALTLSPPGFFAVVFALKSRVQEASWHVWSLLLLSAVGYTTIALMMLRRRHAARSRYYLWLPLAAGFGLAGVLLLMSMLDRPRSVRCASCNKRRLITEGSCRTCTTAAAPPLMQGIEIFEASLCGGDSV